METVHLHIQRRVDNHRTIFAFTWLYFGSNTDIEPFAYDEANVVTSTIEYAIAPFVNLCKMEPTDPEVERSLATLGEYLWQWVPKTTIKSLIEKLEQGTQICIITDSDIPWELIKMDDDYLSRKFAVGRVHLCKSAHFSSKRASPPRLLIIAPVVDLFRLAEQRDYYNLITRIIRGFGELYGKGQECKHTLLVRKIPAKLDSDEAHVLATETNLGLATPGKVYHELIHGEYSVIYYFGETIETSGGICMQLIDDAQNAWKALDREAIASAGNNRKEGASSPDIVFLIACNTGRVGHVGLAESFVEYGARAVIATNWKVVDTVAADFSSYLLEQIRANPYASMGEIVLRARRMLAVPIAYQMAFSLYGSPAISFPWRKTEKMRIHYWGPLRHLLYPMEQGSSKKGWPRLPPGLSVVTESLSLEKLRTKLIETEAEEPVITAMSVVDAGKLASSGLEIRIAGVMFEPKSETVKMICLKNGDAIQDLDDLRGKKVAVNGLFMVPTLLAISAMKHAGLRVTLEGGNTDSVVLVDLESQADALRLLEKHVIDAAVVYWPITRSLSDKYETFFEPQKFFEEKQRRMKVIGQILVTTKKCMEESRAGEKHAGAVATMIDVIDACVQYSFQHQDTNPLLDSATTSEQEEIRSFYGAIKKRSVWIDSEEKREIQNFVQEMWNLASELKELEAPSMPASDLVVEKQSIVGLTPSQPVIIEEIEEPRRTNLRILKERCEEEVRETLFEGKKCTRGVLLYGPPGTGKSTLFADVCEDLKKKGCDLQIVELKERVNPSRAQGLFDEKVAEAKKSGKHTIFSIEEIDRLLPARKKGTDPNLAGLVSNFLAYVSKDSLKEKIFFVGNTNRITDIDAAVYQQERLLPVFVNLPDEETRQRILEYWIQPKSLTDIDVSALIRKTEGFSCSDIRELCKYAKEHAIDQPLEQSDFEFAFKRVRPIPKKELNEHIRSWRRIRSRLP